MMTALALHQVSFPVLLAAVFARSVLSTALKPALMSFIPVVVDKAHLDRANALLRAGEEGAGVVGPLIASLAVSVVGVRGLFALDAVTFLISAPPLLRLPLPGPSRALEGEAPSETPRENVFTSALAGLRVLRSESAAGRVAVGLFLFVLFAGVENVARPFLATGPLGAGGQAIGMLHAAAQLGIILGFLVVARVGLGGHALRAVVAGMLLCSVGSLLTAPAPTLWVALFAQFASGVGNGVAVASIDTLLQRTVPDHLLGRAFANVYGGANVAAGLAYLVGGPLLLITSPRGLFVLTGAGGLGAALVMAALLGH
jgi:MFS family permease